MNYSRHVDSNTNYNLTASTQDGLSEGMVSTSCHTARMPAKSKVTGSLSDSMTSLKDDHEWLGDCDTARYFRAPFNLS
ncbi:hypothetical protein [Providencia hangzhouensis]|uniref:hypothetical protein n=1 Tax=Providencia hangzhouensis TaxID=3031799 RepID=UPI0034DD217A